MNGKPVPSPGPRARSDQRRADDRDPLGIGGADKRGVQSGEHSTTTPGQLEVRGVVHRQPVQQGEVDRDPKVGGAVRFQGKCGNRTDMAMELLRGDAAPSVGDEQGVANLQMKDRRYKPGVPPQALTRGGRSRVLFEKPRADDGRVEDERRQESPSRRAASISSRVIPMRR